MAKKRRQKKKKTSSRPLASQAEVLTPEERQVAMAELGLAESDLQVSSAQWPYLVGGLMVLGALALSARMVTR